MTIGEILTLTDTLQPNQFSWNVKVMWLSDLDGRLKLWRDGLQPVPCAVQTAASEESDDEDEETPPISAESYDWRVTAANQKAEVEAMDAFIPEPWAGDVYANYLCAQMDLANAELDRWQVHDRLFRQYLDEYKRRYGTEAVRNMLLDERMNGGRRRRWRF